ncbi:20876_t:CDS:2, partial [Racocetra persica]
ACQDRNPVYIKLQVPEITANINEQSLTQFDDSSFTNATQSLVFESQSSLSYYIKHTLKYKGEISLLWLLGFTNTENIQFLHGNIGSYFTTIFNIENQFYQEEKEITRLINLGKRVANSNNYDQQSFKKRATQLKNENWKSIQQIIHGLGQKLKNTTSELQNTCKRLYRSQKKALTLQELLEKESDSSRYIII